MGGLGSIGVPGLIIILVIVLIVFGPKKLPEIGSAVGKTGRINICAIPLRPIAN